MKRNAQDRGFMLGVMYTAWFIYDAHGQDSIAEELLMTTGWSVPQLRRLARAEEYPFRRGWWAECQRNRDRRQS